MAVPTTWPVVPPADVARALANQNREHLGDDPTDAGPGAQLSPAIRPDAVTTALRKVADWELARAESYFGNGWTWPPLYVGFLETTTVTGDARYRQAMVRVAEKFQWKLARRFEHADDHCIGQLYLDLHFQQPDLSKITPTREQFDQLITRPQNKWTWCDALYMAPPVWARLARATGEAKYLDYMNQNWWRACEKLYDTEEHLFFRDSKYPTRREANGKKVFWSRGNGWVMGGLVRVLQVMPADHPERGRYITMLKQMSAKLISLQDKQGLWHASLLDPVTYALPESSGSAFIAYGLAYGVNEGILDRATYEPAVTRAWAGLLSCIYEDGRFGCVQQTGEAPAFYKATASYNYGVGAFLLAGSEVHRLAKAHDR